MVAGSVQADTDVLLNKSVSLVAGSTGSYNNGADNLSVMDDGQFVGEETNYNSAAPYAVEWSGSDTFEIDLGASYTVDGALIQADDNDNYLIQYLASDNTWQTLYSADAVSVGYGLRTRPDDDPSTPDVDHTTYAPVGPVVTDAIRVTAFGGDNGYAISEVAVSGAAVVPTPAALWGGLGLLSAIGLGQIAKRRLA